MGSIDLAAIERTLQVAFAPAFVVGGIMALLTGRLQHLAGRHREVPEGGEVPPPERRLLVPAMTFPTMALRCFLTEVLLTARSLPLRHET